jgi:hypothetical protein
MSFVLALLYKHGGYPLFYAAEWRVYCFKYAFKTFNTLVIRYGDALQVRWTRHKREQERLDWEKDILTFGTSRESDWFMRHSAHFDFPFTRAGVTTRRYHSSFLLSQHSSFLLSQLTSKLSIFSTSTTASTTTQDVCDSA